MTDIKEAFVMVPRDVLSDLWRYGNLITVENVVYGKTHKARLKEADDILCRAILSAAPVERPPPGVYVETTPLVPATVADMVSRDQEVERLREALRAQVRAVIEYEMEFFTPTGVQAARCILHKLDEKVFARAALGDST